MVATNFSFKMFKEFKHDIPFPVAIKPIQTAAPYGSFTQGKKPETF